VLGVIGLVVALAGVGLAQWVTGGRSAFGGWSLDDRQRARRRVRIVERFPRSGRWFLPSAYVMAVAGVALFTWAAFSSPS